MSTGRSPRLKRVAALLAPEGQRGAGSDGSHADGSTPPPRELPFRAPALPPWTRHADETRTRRERRPAVADARSTTAALVQAPWRAHPGSTHANVRDAPTRAQDGVARGGRHVSPGTEQARVRAPWWRSAACSAGGRGAPPWLAPRSAAAARARLFRRDRPSAPAPPPRRAACPRATPGASSACTSRGTWRHCRGDLLLPRGRSRAQRPRLHPQAERHPSSPVQSGEARMRDGSSRDAVATLRRTGRRCAHEKRRPSPRAADLERRCAPRTRACRRGHAHRPPTRWPRRTPSGRAGQRARLGPRRAGEPSPDMRRRSRA